MSGFSVAFSFDVFILSNGSRKLRLWTNVLRDMSVWHVILPIWLQIEPIKSKNIDEKSINEFFKIMGHLITVVFVI